MVEFLIGAGCLTLGTFGIAKWNEAKVAEGVVARKTVDLLTDTKSYDRLDQIPVGFRGIMSLNMRGMTHLNGIVSVRKQSEKKVETVVATVDTPYEAETVTTSRTGSGRRHTHRENHTHTHTHTDRVIESHLYWKLLSRQLLPLGVPHVFISPYVEGFEDLTKSLRKTGTEIGTAPQIQSSLATKFNIHFDCYTNRRAHNFRWSHYSFNESMLYFGGKKEPNSFHADKIALSAEAVAAKIMKPENEEIAGKYAGAGAMVTIAALGLIGCVCSAARR